MKKILLSLCILSFAFANAQEPETAGGITFNHGTWKEVLAKAKKENKLVMLDAYTSWCGPCKWMVKNIFPLKEVGDFYNKSFINTKIDMEKGEGLEIAKKYSVMNYPTYLFVDGDGNLVHRVCGSREAEMFVQAGKNALNKETCFTTLQKNYRAKPDNSATAQAYFTAASEACMDVETDVTKFLATQKQEALTGKENYELLMTFINNFDNVSFIYMVNHYKEFTAFYKKEEIDSKIKNVYSTGIKKAVRAKDEKMLMAIQEAYRKEANAPTGYLDSYADVTKAKASKDTSLYFTAIIKFTDGYLMSSASQLNANAWDFYEKTDNKNYLIKAEMWAKKSIEIDPAYYNHDTYAAILFKLGKFPEAKANASKAIELGKKGNEDVKETEQLLEKINEKLKA